MDPSLYVLEASDSKAEAWSQDHRDNIAEGIRTDQTHAATCARQNMDSNGHREDEKGTGVLYRYSIDTDKCYSTFAI
jgi:hypothetical protein